MRVIIHDEEGNAHAYEVNLDGRKEALAEAWRMFRSELAGEDVTPDGEQPPDWAVAHPVINPKHLGTYDRVYGGNPELVHIKDKHRRELGKGFAMALDSVMRERAEMDATGKALCPGCYMIALYDAAVYLAQDNGQSLSELGHTMAWAFTQLAQGTLNLTEEIHVMVDPEASASPNWLVNQPPADGQDHEEPHSAQVAPLLGLEGQEGTSN